jgi:CHAT domain-containing protein
MRQMVTQTHRAAACAAAARVAILALAMLAPIGCGRSRGKTLPGSPSELAARLGPRRAIEPRLTGGFAYAPCRPASSSAAIVAEPRCSPFPRRELARLRRLAAPAPIRGETIPDSTADQLHTQGLFDLLTGTASSIHRAVEKLAQAARWVPRDATLQSDLAAAYIVSAERFGEPYDLVRALEAAALAATIDPSLPEAQFNRALALEKLFLTTEAEAEWRRYQELDSGSGWANEASSRAQSLARRPWDEEWREAKARLEELARRGAERRLGSLVDEYREPAREAAQEQWLPAWADSWAQGSRQDAAGVLGIARLVGAALAQRTSDAMIRDAVAAIDGADDPRRDLLAAGHLAYRQGRVLYLATRYVEAEPVLRRAAAELRAGGSPVAGWCDLFAAVCVHFRPDYPLARRLLEGLRGQAALDRYPTLAGRILYNLGIARTVQGDFGGGLDAYRRALPLFARSGEMENLAAVRHVVAENLDLLGQAGASWTQRYLALSALDRIPNAARRASLLIEATEACLRQGHPWPALAFQDELIRNVHGWGGSFSLPDALLRRSRILYQLGKTDAARQDLEEALSKSARIEDRHVAERLRADILSARAELRGAEDPRAAQAELDSALTFYERAGFRLPLAEAHLRRARLHLGLGEAAAGEADLNAGIQAYEEQRSPLAEDTQRASFFAQSRALFDEMIRLQSGLGRSDAALGYVERFRWRALLDQIARLPPTMLDRGAVLARAGAPLPASEIQRLLPPAVAVLEYHWSGRHLLAWVIASDRLEFVAHETDPDALAEMIRRFNADLKRPDRQAAVRAQAEALYDLILKPVALYIRDKQRLVFVPDGALYSLPFAALAKRGSSRFLVQDYEIEVAPSATVYLRCFDRDRSLGPPVYADILAIGNPAAPEDLFPGVGALPEAEVEAVRVAALYPRSEVLTGRAATPSRFLLEAAGSEVVHFSGHTHLDREYPLLSALLLAPEPGREGSGLLFAHQLYRCRLPRTRLVVLAACSTARGATTAGEEAIGLARPFLAAGVPTVVASLAEVEDAPTLELLTSFHRHLRQTLDPVGALRAAQCERIAHPDQAFAPTWSWAAFEAFGGTAPVSSTR